MKHMERVSRASLKVVAGLAAFSFASAAGAGAIVHVANNGLDTATCGAAATPCRSISQGILNSAAGDTLVVRPGRYGDLDGNGVIDSAGEENGGSIAGSMGGIYIKKKLTIISSAGADATIIDMGNATAAVVDIEADGVKFGECDAGFTITGAQVYGLVTGHVTNVVVAGNTATKNAIHGFFVGTFGVLEARNNRAIANGGAGFLLGSYTLTDSVIFTNNDSIGNGTGISATGASHRISGNRITGNNEGMIMGYGPMRITQNYFAGNRFGVMVNGFDPSAVQTAGPVFTRNSFIGNRNNGFDVLLTPANATVTLRENNFFGNGNCGITNQTNIATLVVDARNNFWGAATGPSFTDPADPVCVGLQPILSTPFATREFQIR